MEDKIFESMSNYFVKFDIHDVDSICYTAAYTNLAVASIVLLIACLVMYHMYRDAIWQTRIALILIIVAQLINLTLTLIILHGSLN